MLKVDPKANQWFKEEMAPENGMGIQIFAKGYGSTNVHEGVSVGVALAEPHDVWVMNDEYDFPYFVIEHDAWLLGDGWLEIKYDEENNEPLYYFHETKENLSESRN